MNKIKGWGLFLFSISILFFTGCAVDEYDDAYLSSDVASATYTVMGTVLEKESMKPFPNLQVILVGVRSGKESLTGDTVYTNTMGQFTVKSVWLKEDNVNFNLKIRDAFGEKYFAIIQPVEIENSYLKPEMLKDLGVIQLDMSDNN